MRRRARPWRVPLCARLESKARSPCRHAQVASTQYTQRLLIIATSSRRLEVVPRAPHRRAPPVSRFTVEVDDGTEAPRSRSSCADIGGLGRSAPPATGARERRSGARARARAPQTWRPRRSRRRASASTRDALLAARPARRARQGGRGPFTGGIHELRLRWSRRASGRRRGWPPRDLGRRMLAVWNERAAACPRARSRRRARARDRGARARWSRSIAVQYHPTPPLARCMLRRRAAPTAAEGEERPRAAARRDAHGRVGPLRDERAIMAARARGEKSARLSGRARAERARAPGVRPRRSRLGRGRDCRAAAQRARARGAGRRRASARAAARARAAGATKTARSGLQRAGRAACTSLPQARRTWPRVLGRAPSTETIASIAGAAPSSTRLSGAWSATDRTCASLRARASRARARVEELRRPCRTAGRPRPASRRRRRRSASSGDAHEDEVVLRDLRGRDHRRDIVVARRPLVSGGRGDGRRASPSSPRGGAPGAALRTRAARERASS